MMERHDHINPWADKLQDIPVPEMNDAWKAMEGLLEEEMPDRRKRDSRRWLLLIILLLLLIGVCNCPGRMHRYMGLGGNGPAKERERIGREEGAGRESRETMDSGVGKGKNAGGDLQQDEGENGRSQGKEGKEARDEQTMGGSADWKHRGSNIKREKEEISTRKEKTVMDSSKEKRTGSDIMMREVEENSSGRAKDGSDAGRKKRVGRSANGKKSGGEIEIVRKGGSTVRTHEAGATGKKSGKREGVFGDEQAGGIVGKRANADESKGPGGKEPVPVRPAKADDTVGRIVKGGDTIVRASQKDTAVVVKKAMTKKMLAQKRADSVAVAEKKADSIRANYKGWVAGIGLNQFFTVGQQEQSNYNSSGTTGGIRDYIPVPMIRYYFNKKLFVQLEAQFNTPQYTKKDLLASESKVDTTTIPTAKLQSVLYIKKLFYFNVPLSVHYSPFPNFYVGAGLQYSRLTNGVGLFQDKASPRYTTGADTIKKSQVQSFKNDTTYQKMRTNELRLLFDLSYTYKKFIIGARYNRALSNFIDVRISDAQVTQSRNSSIQVYLRYILWDGRKKKLSPK
jgi:hypothetical protein